MFRWGTELLKVRLFFQKKKGATYDPLSYHHAAAQKFRALAVASSLVKRYIKKRNGTAAQFSPIAQ